MNVPALHRSLFLLHIEFAKNIKLYRCLLNLQCPVIIPFDFAHFDQMFCFSDRGFLQFRLRMALSMYPLPVLAMLVYELCLRVTLIVL